MLYCNGFQSIHIPRGFVQDLALYDTKLYVWQDLDGFLYISYSDRGTRPTSLGQARSEQVMRIQRDDGTPREPDNRDLYGLMRNDGKHVAIDAVYDRAFSSQRAAEEARREALRNEYQEAFYGLTLARKRRPSVYE